MVDGCKDIGVGGQVTGQCGMVGMVLCRPYGLV
jgi:hypothetical protein